VQNDCSEKPDPELANRSFAEDGRRGTRPKKISKVWFRSVRVEIEGVKLI